MTRPWLVRGDLYNWKYDPGAKLIYRGKNFSGNGYWHQFATVEDPDVIWCEVTDREIPLFEKTPVKGEAAPDGWVSPQQGEWRLWMGSTPPAFPEGEWTPFWTTPPDTSWRDVVQAYLAADDALREVARRTGFGGMGPPVASEAEQRRVAVIRHAAREKLDSLLGK